MQKEDIDSSLVRNVAIRLLKANPNGVRTKEVSDDPELKENHFAEFNANAQAYRSLIGKILNETPEIHRADPNDESSNKLWIL